MFCECAGASSGSSLQRMPASEAFVMMRRSTGGNQDNPGTLHRRVGQYYGRLRCSGACRLELLSMTLRALLGMLLNNSEGYGQRSEISVRRYQKSSRHDNLERYPSRRTKCLMWTQCSDMALTSYEKCACWFERYAKSRKTPVQTFG